MIFPSTRRHRALFEALISAADQIVKKFPSAIFSPWYRSLGPSVLFANYIQRLKLINDWKRRYEFNNCCFIQYLNTFWVHWVLWDNKTGQKNIVCKLASVTCYSTILELELKKNQIFTKRPLGELTELALKWIELVVIWNYNITFATGKTLPFWYLISIKIRISFKQH